ncbi:MULTISPECIES: hypothetical protein [unclassified Butyrivibrio]|uniref:hypothetical protein n=1 Tax=unclassified Butyrivibrio TaxID=2639466 RepID=UPI0003F96F33|nr:MULTISPECIES: hypothetical protein [unclassified Butyrivibrio]
MGKELFIKQLRPYLYLMDEAHEATGYIVVGNEKVCVIDTMNGYNDLHKVVRDITDNKQHPFKLEEGKTYQQLESVICYR